MNLNFALLLFLSLFSSAGQCQSAHQNLLQVDAVRAQIFFETAFDRPKWRFANGVSYLHQMPKGWWLGAAASYVSNEYEDFCRGCYDAGSGKGRVTEGDFALVARVDVKRRNGTWSVYPFYSQELMYTYTEYKYFYGSFAWVPSSETGKYKAHKILLNHRVGVHLNATKHLNFSVSSAAGLGYVFGRKLGNRSSGARDHPSYKRIEFNSRYHGVWPVAAPLAFQIGILI